MSALETRLGGDQATGRGVGGRNSGRPLVAVGVVAGLVLAGVGVGNSAVAAVPAGPAVTAQAASAIHAKTEVLAYLVGDEPGVVISAPSTGTKRTILAGQTVVDPAISPDASELAYTATTPAGPAGLYVEPVDESSAPVLLVTLVSADSVAHPHWSPDGTELVYTRVAADSSRTEVVVDSTTGAQVFATSDAGADATIMADEAHLLSSDSRGVVRTSFDDGASVVLSRYGTRPVQSAGGHAIAVVQRFVGKDYVSFADYEGYSISPGGSEPPGVADGLIDIDSMAWAGDGSVLYAAMRPVAGMPGSGTRIEAIGLFRPLSSGAVPAAEAEPVSTISVGAAPRPLTTSETVFSPLDPARILDTRSVLGGHHGRVGPMSTVSLVVANNGGVPVGASSVVLDVTVVAPTATTSVAVTSGSSRAASLVGLRSVAGLTATTETTVALDARGRVNLTNRSGTVDLVADVVGYYSTTEGYGYTPITPAAVVDHVVPMGRADVVPLTWPGINRVPDDTVAVTLAVVADHPSSRTRLSVGPYVPGRRYVQTTSLSASTGTRTAANIIVKTGSGGDIAFYNQSGSVRVQVYITGFFSPESHDAFTVEPRTRIADTRSGLGMRISSGSAGDVRITENPAVPGSPDAVVLDATSVANPIGLAISVGRATSVVAPAGRTVVGNQTSLVPSTGLLSYSLSRVYDEHAVVWDLLGYYTE